MDNLKLQTVYVPVEGDLDDRPVLCVWFDDEDNDGWQYLTDLDKQDNRIVLTPQELAALIEDVSLLAIKEMPMTQWAMDKMVSGFLKSKGVVI